MTGSIRRRITAILALAVGFGVVIGPSPALAIPAYHSHVVTVPAPAGPPVGQRTAPASADWWW
jgi:hypothetical protein